jgi:hydrogenase maturation protease
MAADDARVPVKDARVVEVDGRAPAPDARVLLIGYGNPARGDDGLGPALAAAVAEWALDGVTVETDYQLHVEHAADAAEYDVVIFADADVVGPGPFRFRTLEPKTELSFTSHSVSPAGILGLAQRLFSARSRGYVLGIRGHAFGEFAEELSEEARRNLAVALAFMEKALRTRSFPDAAHPDEPVLTPG